MAYLSCILSIVFCMNRIEPNRVRFGFGSNRIESKIWDSDSDRTESSQIRIRFSSVQIRFDSDSRFEFDFQRRRRFLLKKREPAPFFNKNKWNWRHFLLKKMEPGFLIKKTGVFFLAKK